MKFFITCITIGKNIKTPLEVLLRKLVVNWCIGTHKYYLN